jgi:nitroimidazol reductase NimA-like FMN-containing flavoprotein (pyridoxamine 5'-phosphate oxidase superfamily)
MSSSEDVIMVIKSLLVSQRFAVLATDHQEQPYLFLMAFAATADLKKIVLVTERETQKYAHLKSNRRIALLIDDRENRGADTKEAVVVSVLGEAEEVEEGEAHRLRDLYLERHPYLDEFAQSPSCAIIQVQVSSYRVVRKFQEVVEWCPDPK